ncbi:unnamed protein product [Malus baccata var. baccata]
MEGLEFDATPFCCPALETPYHDDMMSPLFSPNYAAHHPPSSVWLPQPTVCPTDQEDSPTSPVYNRTTSTCNLTSPAHSLASLAYSPNFSYSPTSPSYSPISTAYSPTSPSYS